MESRCLKRNRSSGKRNRLYWKPSAPSLQYAKLLSMSAVLLPPRPRAAVLSEGHWEGLSAWPLGSLLHCRSPQVPPDTHRCPPRSEPDGTPVRLHRDTACSDSHTYRTSHTRSIVRDVSNYTTAPSPGVPRHPEILHTGTARFPVPIGKHAKAHGEHTTESGLKIYQIPSGHHIVSLEKKGWSHYSTTHLRTMTGWHPLRSRGDCCTDRLENLGVLPCSSHAPAAVRPVGPLPPKGRGTAVPCSAHSSAAQLLCAGVTGAHRQRD